MASAATLRSRAPGHASTLTQKSVDYLKRNYKYLVEDPSYFWMKTLARFELARALARRANLASQESQRLSSPAASGFCPRADPPASTVELEASASAREQNKHDDTPRVTADHGTTGALRILEADGYYVGLRLTQDTLSQLQRRSALATVYGDGDPGMPFELGERASAERLHERTFRRGSYLAQHEDWPEFVALREDRCLQAIAARYLGCTPICLHSELSWTYARAPHAPPSEREPFKCNIRDFRSLTFTFYLTDVGPGNGPHTYIKKKPRKRPLGHQLLGQHCSELSEESLAHTYGTDQIVTIYGPKGLGFVGDPYYLHRSTEPTQREHLLLRLELGCRRYRTDYH